MAVTIQYIAMYAASRNLAGNTTVQLLLVVESVKSSPSPNKHQVEQSTGVQCPPKDEYRNQTVFKWVWERPILFIQQVFIECYYAPISVLGVQGKKSLEKNKTSVLTEPTF